MLWLCCVCSSSRPTTWQLWSFLASAKIVFYLFSWSKKMKVVSWESWTWRAAEREFPEKLKKLWTLTIIIWILFGKSWLYILMISSAFIRCDDKLCFHQMKLSGIYLVCRPVPKGRNFCPFFPLLSFWSIYWKFETFLIMTIIWILHGKSWLYILMISSAFIWWTCHAFILLPASA